MLSNLTKSKGSTLDRTFVVLIDVLQWQDPNGQDQFSGG